MQRRSADELAAVDDPAWPAVSSLLDRVRTATALEVDPERGRRVLFSLQVTARSYLGALALNTGGILADHGWFRLLGGGSDHLDDVASVNNLDGRRGTHQPPPFLLVGFDALGGRFAIDGGGLGVAAGEVCYFGPDTLSWGGLGGGHADFVTAAISGALSQTFAPLRWSGWQDEVAALRADQGLSIYPPPFSREGQDIAAASRRAVPVRELVYFYDEAARQLGAPSA
ncbi:hypothetical protein DDP54_02305 [Cellulomonas sp. WB94]|uniref:DUF2625 family protein n=1 Tax=Cellulomonas sp. WB94 TaxID=2173174 RepID=UPI000D56F812|nr:DUF2625 family protein [Cellulomonas sp. WB94]PVU82034.1 hypothetical protein DDP54_02305 [Cellulomonas sp. WB94]